MTDLKLEPIITDTVERLKRPEPEIRMAQYHDVHGIRLTLQRALEETETPLPPPDEPYCLQQVMDQTAQGFVAVAEVDDRIVGCIVLAVNHWPWCAPGNPTGHYLYNQHFWVDPQNRRGGTAAKLLKFAKDVAEGRQLPLMLEIGCADSNSELKDRFVKQSGFKYIGGKFYRQAQGD
jgi:GNAT superfamily N-acetyltransferase